MMPRPTAAQRAHPDPGGRRLEGRVGPEAAAGQLQRLVGRLPRGLVEQSPPAFHTRDRRRLGTGPGSEKLVRPQLLSLCPTTSWRVANYLLCLGEPPKTGQ